MLKENPGQARGDEWQWSESCSAAAISPASSQVDQDRTLVAGSENQRDGEPIECDHESIEGSRRQAANETLPLRQQHPNPGHIFNVRRCVVCQQPLSVHERAIGKTCSRADCKHAALRADLQEQAERQSALQNKALAHRESIVRSHAIDAPEQLGLVILPSNVRRLTNLPAKRMTRFRDRLMRIIGEAAAIRFGRAEPTEPDDDPKTPPPLDAAQSAILGNACAVCRGDCCPQGSDHAFIQIKTILDYMERHPQRRPREILEDYLSRVGKKIYDGSCIYHSANGCLLPREMRSSICNGYLCKGLNQLLFQLPIDGEPRTFVISMAGEEIVRSAIIDKDRHKLYNETDDRESDRTQNGDGCD